VNHLLLMADYDLDIGLVWRKTC